MPTRLGSKHSDGMFPEVLADEEELLLIVFDLLLEHDREEEEPPSAKGW